MSAYLDIIANGIASNWKILVSGLLGALIGGLMAGRYLVWQTREIAKHNLRAIAIRIGVHAQQCKGIQGQRTDPWSVYMEDAIAAYLRYRALLFFWQRKALDDAWAAFQGTKPFGDTPFAYAPMGDNIQGFIARTIIFLKVIQ